MVAITSVIGAVGAAVVFAIIGLFTRRPVRLFRIAAVVVGITGSANRGDGADFTETFSIADGGVLGGFNRSKQHPEYGGVEWDDRRVGVRR